jgi:hypothetical protein
MTSFSRLCFALASTLVLCAGAACSAGNASPGAGGATGNGTFAATTLSPCEPMAGQAISLPAPLLGIGKDKNGTLYVVAGTDPADGAPRVFILDSGRLEERSVIGASMKGGGSAVSYNLGYVKAGADYADYSSAHTLLLAVSGGKATAMALGAITTKGMIGDPSEANDEMLALQDVSAISGLAADGLPLVPEHIGHLADGTALVVLRSADSLRLFYGAPGALDERTIVTSSGTAPDDTISFDVDGDTYVATYHYLRSKGGEGGTNGMGDSSTWSLDTPGSTVAVAITFDTTAISGAAFQCLSVN